MTQSALNAKSAAALKAATQAVVTRALLHHEWVLEQSTSARSAISVHPLLRTLQKAEGPLIYERTS